MPWHLTTSFRPDLGRLQDAALRYEELKRFALGALRREAKIDYFATSLPLLLVFEDDLGQAKNEHARLLCALAEKGLKLIA